MLFRSVISVVAPRPVAATKWSLPETTFLSRLVALITSEALRSATGGSGPSSAIAPDIALRTASGVTPRAWPSAAAAIMTHGDDSGLILPPKVAPWQVVIVPIPRGNWKETVLPKCQEIRDQLQAAGIRVKLDADDGNTPGWKFSEYEMRGVPLRLEIGPKDIEKSSVFAARRDTRAKQSLPMDGLAARVTSLLDEIQAALLDRARAFRDSHTSATTSYEEFKSIMKRLVLDLRSNPGGQLDQAIRIANRFLSKGAMVVYTRGRVPNSDQDYHATDTPEYGTVPMITLVNRSSASASEIVSGALQDHDRSLIIGETTFGKALVQSVYRVSGGAGLALTTARYYTPSGRLIQRPWDGTFDEYLTYTMKDQSQRTHTDDQLKYTDGGRKVYSGGGIEPDERFEGPIEGFNPTRFGRSLFNRGLFATYAEQFYYDADTRPGSKSPNFKYVKKNFEATPEMVAEFKKFVISRNTKMDEDAWNKDLDFIKAMVRFEIDQAVFDIATARQHLTSADPQARYALTRFSEAEKLSQLSRGKSSRIGQ